MRRAMIAEIAELVSPSTNTASGRSAASTRSLSVRILPSVSPSVPPPVPRKWSGFLTPRSSKNTSFNS